MSHPTMDLASLYERLPQVSHLQREMQYHAQFAHNG